MGVDLSIGGPSWAGWYFAKWGRARDWRICSPCGACFTAGELGELRAALLDVDYLRARLRELSDFTASDALHFGPADARVLIGVAELVLRAARQFSIHKKERFR